MNKDFYCDNTKQPTFSYRSDLTVYEETFDGGSLMSSGWNASGYPLNVLSNCDTRLEHRRFAQPSAFEVELDGESLSYNLSLVSCSKESTDKGIHCTVTLKSNIKPVEIVVHTLLDETALLTRWLEVKNVSETAMRLNRLSVMSGGVEIMNDVSSKLTQHGDVSTYYSLGYFDCTEWGFEGDFNWHPLTADSTAFSGRFTRNRYRHPMFMLKNNVLGTILTAQLAWSAGYEFSFDYNTHNDIRDTCLSFKSSITSYNPLTVIGAGESFVSPEIHIGIVSGGLDDAVNAMNCHLRKTTLCDTSVITNRCLVGSGMGAEHDMSVETTKCFADQMAQIGCEVFIVDAGWYCPPSEEQSWYNYAGDWYYNKDRYPNGLCEISDYIHSKGMKFGLWVEIERMGKLSKMHEAHPEWITTSVFGEKSDGFLDFSNPDVCEWAENELARIINENSVDLLRVDYNIDSAAYFHMGVKHGYTTCNSYEHFNNVYKMYSRLMRRFPEVIFENCAGGGGRTDIGMLKAFNHTWVSDCQTAPRSLYITNGMTMALPPERVDRLVAGMGCHAFGSLDLHMRNAMLGHVSMNVFNPATASPNSGQLEFISHSIEIYKSFIRTFLPESLVYHHTPETRTIKDLGYSVLEIASADGCKGAIGIFTVPNCKAESIHITPKGLDVSRHYRVTFDNSRKTTNASGFSLMNDGINIRVPSPLSSELILFNAEN